MEVVFYYCRCDYNKYTMRVILRRAQLRKKEIESAQELGISPLKSDTEIEDELTLIKSNNNMEVDEPEDEDKSESEEDDYL